MPQHTFICKDKQCIPKCENFIAIYSLTHSSSEKGTAAYTHSHTATHIHTETHISSTHIHQPENTYPLSMHTTAVNIYTCTVHILYTITSAYAIYDLSAHDHQSII